MSEVDTTTTDYQNVSYVISSDYRVDALDVLADGESTPSRIAKRKGHDTAHTSRALRELRDRNLVELKVSDDTKTGRIYGLTEAGRVIVEKVREVARDE